MMRSKESRQLHNQKKEELLIDDLINDFMLQQRYQVKESTYAHYVSLLETHIRPYFGNMYVTEVTSGMIELYASKKLQNGKLNKKGGLSPKTVKDLLSLIRLILKYGVTRGIIGQQVLFFSGPRITCKEIQVFSKAEQKRLEDFVLKSEDTMHLGIYLSLYTGIRLGEICALKWSDINFEERYLNIDKTISRIKNVESAGKKTKLLIDTPKTSASKRKIPLSIYLSELLLKHKQNAFSKDSFFLTGTEKFIEPRNYYNKYKSDLSQCDLSSYTFHALRHTFATRCIEKGVDPKSLSEILGHADVKITLDRYVHPSLEHKRACMELLFS